jgi:hypothetical protein
MKEIWMFLLAALAIIAIAWYLARRARKHGEKRILKEQVQTWEDEGGNVPEVPTERNRKEMRRPN